MFTVSRYVPGSYESQNSGDEKDQGSSGPSVAHGSSALYNAEEPSEVESSIPSKSNRRYSDVEFRELKPRRQPGTDKMKNGKKKHDEKSLVNLSPSTLTKGNDSLGDASGMLKSRVSGSSHEMKEKRFRKRSRVDDSCERRRSRVARGVDKMVEPSLLLVPDTAEMRIVTDGDDTSGGNNIASCVL